MPVAFLVGFTTYRLLYASVKIHQGPLLLTWFNFNPDMDKQSHGQQSMGWNHLSITEFERRNRRIFRMDK